MATTAAAAAAMQCALDKTTITGALVGYQDAQEPVTNKVEGVHRPREGGRG